MRPSQGSVLEPSGETIQVEGSGRGHALECRLRQSTIAGSAQAKAAYALRDRALDALPLRVQAPALLALVLFARCRQCLVLGTRMQGQPTACRSGTARFGRTRPAIARVEAGSDERATARCVPVLAPARALMPLRAAHAAALPVDGEVRHLDPLGIAPLPTVIGPRRADQVDAVPCSGHHQLLGAHVYGIDQMLGRSQACLGQRFVDRAGANGFVHVGRRGGRCGRPAAAGRDRRSP